MERPIEWKAAFENDEIVEVGQAIRPFQLGNFDCNVQMFSVTFHNNIKSSVTQSGLRVI